MAQPKPTICLGETVTIGDDYQTLKPPVIKSVNNPRLSVPKTGDDRGELESIDRLGKVDLVSF